MNDLTHSRFLALATAAADGFRSIALPADGEAHTVGGVLCWRSASSVPVFNSASLLTATDINRETLTAVSDYFRGRLYSVMALDALVPNSHALLADFGYEEYDALPAMWLGSTPHNPILPPAYRLLPSRSEGDALRVLRVESSEDLALYRIIVGQAFGLPADEVDLILSERALSVPPMHHYLAWWGNMPVGTVSLVLIGGVAGVWNVGTLTEYRRRGVGIGMMRHALAEAHTLGYRRCMLLSSTEGLALYARLGFTTLSTLRVFVPQ